MPQVVKSALLPHSAESMFALVDAVERYPEFVPWCGGARVHSRDADHTRATIDIRYLGVAQSLTTHNLKRHPEEMTLALVEGPFASLGGAWRFTALAADACKVEFSLGYTFASPVVAGVIGPVMAAIADTLVDRFAARAAQLAANLPRAAPPTTLP